MPNVSPLKGEVAAKRTEGFNNAEFGNSSVWFPNSSTGCAAAGGQAMPAGLTSVGVWGSVKRSGTSPSRPAAPPNNLRRSPQIQLVKKGFDKLVDGEASSPATTTLTSFC